MEVDFANAVALIAITVATNAGVVVYKSGKTDERLRNLEERIKRLDGHIEQLYAKLWETKK